MVGVSEYKRVVCHKRVLFGDGHTDRESVLDQGRRDDTPRQDRAADCFDLNVNIITLTLQNKGLDSQKLQLALIPESMPAPKKAGVNSIHQP